MNHDREFTINRLRSLALQFERGEMDGEFTAAIEAGDDIAPLREAMIVRCNQLVDEIEGRE
jgi:hypothetical protein